MRRAVTSSLQIPRLVRPTVTEFRRFVRDRVPLVIRGALDGWRAPETWTFERLAALGGELDVRVQLRRTERAQDFDYKNVKFRDFLTALRAGSKGDYLAASALFDRIPALWHDVQLPIYLERARVLPRVFIGPGGAFSALHYDLAHGLSAHVMGRKQVSCFLFRRRDLVTHPDLVRPGWVSDALDAAPRAGRAVLAPARRWEALLEPGELLYLPSRLHHMVRSLDDTITVNFFWHDLPMRGVRWVLQRFGRLVM